MGRQSKHNSEHSNEIVLDLFNERRLVRIFLAKKWQVRRLCGLIFEVMVDVIGFGWLSLVAVKQEVSTCLK